VIRCAVMVAVLAAVFAGCEPMYNSGTPGAGQTTTTTTTDDTGTSPGVFPDGSHDVVGATPPSLEDETDEGAATFSHFRAIQIDPRFEDTAGPKFIVPADVDRDGLVDLVTGWNQSQPIQVHLQRRDGNAIRFEAINVIGTMPIAVLGDIDVADLNGDQWPDIAVAVKHTGTQAFCGDAPVTWCGTNGLVAEPEPFEADVGEVMILFNPGTAEGVRDGAQWAAVAITGSLLDGRRDEPYERAQRAPEWNSYTALAVGDLTCDGLPDIVVCFNPAVCEDECEKNPLNRLVLYANPGSGGSPTNWAAAWADVPDVWIYAASGPIIKDVVIHDVDDDGNLDVVFTNPDQTSPNIHWARNDCGQWNLCPVGHIDSDADVITMGDVDGDGYDDVMARSAAGHIVEWFKRPTGDDTEPIFPPNDPPNPDRTPPSNQAFCSFPWPVFAVTEFEIRQPEGIALGDVTGDGQVEAIVAAGGAVFWYEFDPEAAGGVFDQWVENFVVDDSKDEGQTVDPNDPDFEDEGTFINTVLVLDVDDDGVNDILATLDRRTKSGQADDTLIWFRNTKFDSGD
jgi:hypothetical protein